MVHCVTHELLLNPAAEVSYAASKKILELIVDIEHNQ